MIRHLKDACELYTPADLEKRVTDILDKKASYSVEVQLHTFLAGNLLSSWPIFGMVEDQFRDKGMQHRKTALNEFQGVLVDLRHRLFEGEIGPTIRLQIAWSADPDEQVIHYVARYTESGQGQKPFSQEIRIAAYRHRPA